MTGGQSQRFFAETYAEARDWFVEAVHAQGGDLQSHVLDGQSGALGEVLVTDVAWFGSADAARVFVSISGTHGQEFFSGAAAQLAWVRSNAGAPLPEGVAVCLVHAHNPYGASFNSRGNENFVDLNRNYFDPGAAIRPNDLYPPLYDLLFTQDMNEQVLHRAMADFYAFVAAHDTKQAMTAMGGGQNTHPSGTLYCGGGDESSTLHLRGLVKQRLSKAQKVALIDWHTGLGDYGEVTVMLDGPVHSEHYRWACAWWGGPSAAEALQPQAEAPDYIGMVGQGMADDLRKQGACVASAVVEFGTVDNEAVLGALLIDRWLRFACNDPQSPHAVRLRTMMMERLNPALPSWRSKVLDHASRLYSKTITGLANWED